MTNLVMLLLDAVATESEFLSGPPSLYHTLDQITPLDEAGIEAVLDRAESTDDIDVLAFCCQLVCGSVSARSTPLPDELCSDVSDEWCEQLNSRVACPWRPDHPRATAR